ncbi:PP2C family protein-serine/threonine phosphatase [Streptomyces xanthophaeus]|uniref:PP2C family protein-serine/threonine phosphatase n=1 Tax=Streptomyces xanthophaeus TaxID=67385 RepID=UPI0037184CA5
MSHTLARDLQAGLLLPDLPDVSGADVATYYHPAGEGLDIGGDLYDVFPLEDGPLGLPARRRLRTRRHRHHHRPGPPHRPRRRPLLPGPADVVKAVNRALNNRPDSHGTGFVTLVYGQLTPTPTGLDIELVRAGHTPSLHLDTHRAARTVDAQGMLLGIGPNPHVTPLRLHLHPHESLVLYTDGAETASCSTNRASSKPSAAFPPAPPNSRSSKRSLEPSASSPTATPSAMTRQPSY